MPFTILADLMALKVIKEPSAMIFINNKYTKWYNSIIFNAKQRSLQNVYSETHHIIPISLGGNNDKSNLVSLTAKEHFICHLLLVKMVDDTRHKTSMQYACFRMSHVSVNTKNRYKINANSYAIIKKNLAHAASTTHSGRIHSDISRQLRSAALKGRISPTKGLVAWNRGIKMSDDAKQKASTKLKGRTPWNKGIPVSAESNIKRKEKQSGVLKEVVSCPHCNKTGGKPVMIRHHFDNCKMK